MKRLVILCALMIVALALAVPCSAQQLFINGNVGSTAVVLYDSTGTAIPLTISTTTVAATGTLNASVKLVIPSGAAPASTCTVGEIFIDTDQTVDTNCTTTADNSLCICTATNTWTALENN